jgi:hypothetical protein
MYKNLFFISLLLFGLNVNAEANWILIGKNTGGDQFFLDKNSIERNGDVVTFYRRQNFAQKTEKGDMSSKTQASVNCRTREQLALTIMLFDKANNLGKETRKFTFDDTWKPIASGAVSWYFLQYVCQ